MRSASSDRDSAEAGGVSTGGVRLTCSFIRMYSRCLKSLVRWRTDRLVAVKDRQSTFIHVLDRKLACAQRPEKRSKSQGAGNERDSYDDNGDREQGHEERCVLNRENMPKNIFRFKHYIHLFLLKTQSIPTATTIMKSVATSGPYSQFSPGMC